MGLRTGFLFVFFFLGAGCGFSFSDEAYEEWSGYVSTEARLFMKEAAHPGQHDRAGFSLAFQPEYYREWDDRSQSLTFVPFLRLDQHDNERNHFDIRELFWMKTLRDWELSVGIRKIFWGVTESQHLVDIINQTDLVENIDTEDKLGQPMVKLAWTQDWGTLEAYMMPFFRERTFPGRKGRLRFKTLIDTEHPLYASGADVTHVDWAFRWSHSISYFDVGVSHFSGTSREPRFVESANADGNKVFRPLYETIDQTGVDVQVTKGDWLGKFELIMRDGQGGRFTAATAGFEYTLVGILDSPKDLGILMEYLFDDRGDSSPSQFQNDIFAGIRLTWNDVQSTELLAGLVIDADNQSTFLNIEASRRLGDSWKLILEVRWFLGLEETDPFFDLRRDSVVQMELQKYF